LRIRILVVDDFQPWCCFVSAALRREPEFEVIGEAYDGQVGVQMAAGLQPDLILLDIGLPGLNGLQAAGQIREVSPKSRILFVTQDRSAEIARQAFSIGACGYVVKSDAASELLPAVRAVLRGQLFASACLGLADDESVPENRRRLAPMMRSLLSLVAIGVLE